MQIKNRIKELRYIKASELVPNPKNWRTHPTKQKDALKGVLAEIGYADALLARELEDGSVMLLDGHLRAETTPEQEVPVLILDLTEEEGDKLLATLDPLASMADQDDEKLIALLEGIETDNDAVRDMLDKLAGNEDEEEDETYTRKIETPVYEMKGENPPVSTLYDKKKTSELVDKIDKSGVSLEEKEFLISAAQRHIVFNYGKIAEYYANATAEMQGLMEESALVLIDFDKAIENGWIKMNNKFLGMIKANQEI